MPGRSAASLALLRDGAEGPECAWAPAAGAAEPRLLAYSVTKTLIAAVALSLQDEGRLALDAPLARWQPGVPGAARMPLRRLLDHTAGIPDYGALPAYHAAVRERPGRPWSLAELAEHTWERGPLFEPGSGFAYSNPGYLLLRRVLEEVAGAGLGALLRERITGPLGLAHTALVETPEELAALAPAVSTLLSPDATPRDVRHAYHPGWVCHGVVASTSSELVRFLDALLGARLVSARAVAELETLVRVPAAMASGGRWREPSYGLGVMADPASPVGALLGHEGGGPGYAAALFQVRRADGSRATACALCASEAPGVAADLVLAALAGPPDAAAR